MPKHIVPSNFNVSECVKLLVNYPASPDFKDIVRLISNWQLAIGCLQGAFHQSIQLNTYIIHRDHVNKTN